MIIYNSNKIGLLVYVLLFSIFSKTMGQLEKSLPMNRLIKRNTFNELDFEIANQSINEFYFQMKKSNNASLINCWTKANLSDINEQKDNLKLVKNRFDESDLAIDLNGNPLKIPALKSQTGDFSVILWITLESYQGLLSNTINQGTNIIIKRDHIQFILDEKQEPNNVSIPFEIELNQWLHFALVVNNKTSFVYINGIEYKTGLETWPNNGSLNIYNVSFYDDIQQYENALISREIMIDFLKSKPDTKISLIHNWLTISKHPTDTVSVINIIDSKNVSMVNNRHNITNSAIYLKNGFLKANTSIFFHADLTITAWINLEAYRSWSTILDFGQEPPFDNVHFGFYDNKPILEACLYNRNDFMCLTALKFKIKLNKWYHVAFVLRKSIGFIYVNGIEVTTSALLSPNNVTRTKNYIGKSCFDTDEAAYAFYSDINIYSNGLLHSQIIADYVLNVSSNLTFNNIYFKKIKAILKLVKELQNNINFINDDYQNEDYDSENKNATLVNHWSMSSLEDIIGKKDFTPRNNYSFVNGRLSNPESAIYLNNGYLEAQSNHSFFNRNFSLLAWINLKSNQSWTTVLNFSNDAQSENIILGFEYTNLKGFISSKKRNRSITTSISICLNKWYHIGFTLKDFLGYLYLNGTLVSNITVLLPLKTVNRSQNFIVGNGNGQFVIDDIKIFQEALSPEQIVSECQKKDSEDQSRFLYFMIIVTILFLILISAILIIMNTLRRKRKQPKIEMNENIEMNGKVVENYYSRIRQELQKLTLINEKNLEFIEKIGSGTFGEVFYGLLKREKDSPSLKVAIKKCRGNASDSDKRDLLKEAILLSSSDHNNLLKMYGVVCKTEHLECIVIEYMNKGDLLSFLRESRTSFNALKLRKVIQIISDISEGCAYLERNKMIHRDLAARNCLLSQTKNEFIVKIGDFGLARELYSYSANYQADSSKMLPLRWMSPEAILDGHFSIKSDVWSFGILVSEILTLGGQPYQGMNNNEVVEYVRNGGFQLPDDSCPKPITKLLTLCWSFYGDKRPKFESILKVIKLLKSIVKDSKKTDDSLSKADEYMDIEASKSDEIVSDPLEILIQEIIIENKCFDDYEPLPYVFKCNIKDAALSDNSKQ